jgi:antibiotic biosynthesis monooxygenase (ABM) superfamily enzyme
MPGAGIDQRTSRPHATAAVVTAVADSEPVTVVTSRRVRPGREAEFENWLEGIGREAQRFPGFIDGRIIRPKDHAHPEYVIVFKFDSYSHLKAWNKSPIRRDWLQRVRPLVLDEYREQVLTGLEQWFTLSHQPGLAPPPRYKMAAMTLMVLYPLALVLGRLFAPVVAPVPTVLRPLPVMATMVLLTTYVVMPRVTRLFRRWLYPGEHS